MVDYQATTVSLVCSRVSCNCLLGLLTKANRHWMNKTIVWIVLMLALGLGSFLIPSEMTVYRESGNIFSCQLLDGERGRLQHDDAERRHDQREPGHAGPAGPQGHDPGSADNAAADTDANGRSLR